MLLQKGNATFESINVGDILPTIQRHETQQDINNYLTLNERPQREVPGSNLHTDEEFADKGIFGGMVNYGVVTCAFMTDLLLSVFPARNVVQGIIEMRATEPVRAEDVITFAGKVLDKREEDGKRIVELEVTGTNQLGQAVAAAKATVPL